MRIRIISNFTVVKLRVPCSMHSHHIRSMARMHRSSHERSGHSVCCRRIAEHICKLIHFPYYSKKWVFVLTECMPIKCSMIIQHSALWINRINTRNTKKRNNEKNQQNAMPSLKERYTFIWANICICVSSEREKKS